MNDYYGLGVIVILLITALIERFYPRYSRRGWRVLWVYTLLYLLLQVGGLVGWSFSTLNYYLQDRVERGLSHEIALCNAVEFADNVFMSMGIDNGQARRYQKEAFTAYCNPIIELEFNAPIEAIERLGPRT